MSTPEAVRKALADIERQEQSDASQQGTAAWLFERVGYCTASRFQDVIAKTKAGKYTAARETYLWELVIERITAQPSDHWTSTAMQWGTDNENRSKMAYESATGAILEPCGFVKHPTIKWVGASPDALINDDGGFESKSPYNSRYHLETVISKQMPDEHRAQVQGGMWVTGRKWWDFQSFDPRLPDDLQRFTQRIERDDTYIAMLEAEIIVFGQEVEQRVQQILEGAEASK